MSDARPTSYSSEPPRKKKPLQTINLPLSPNEMLKPRELIEVEDVKGFDRLTLFDRRVYNKLLRNAHGPDLGKPDSSFVIRLADLRGGHDSNDRIGDTLLRLMQAVIRLKMTDGSTTQVALLGANNFSDPSRPDGRVTYQIDPKLAFALSKSIVFAKLQLDVMQAFRSGYAFALYEAVALRARLNYVHNEEISLKQLREQFLCVPKKRLPAFGSLRQSALDPAVAEINKIAHFNVSYIPMKQGRKVTGVNLFWYPKDEAQMKEQYQELQRRQPKQHDMFNVLES